MRWSPPPAAKVPLPERGRTARNLAPSSISRPQREKQLVGLGKSRVTTGSTRIKDSKKTHGFWQRQLFHALASIRGSAAHPDGRWRSACDRWIMAVVHGYVGVTDGEWYRFLAARPELAEVNSGSPAAAASS